MIEFEVPRVGWLEDDDEGYAALVLAAAGPGDDRLEIQLAFDFDDQDARLGQDTYCLVTGTGAAVYGGITDWWLDGRILRIEVDDETAEALDADGGWRLVLAADVDTDEVEAQLAGLLTPPERDDDDEDDELE